MINSATQWAVVTGASSGLGVALATELASRRINLVLVARREAPMRELGTRLGGRHGIDVVVEPMDLAEPDSAVALQERLDRRGIEPTILINNAGYGLNGPFLDHDPKRLRSMLQLDIGALTELTHVFGRRMAARGAGMSCSSRAWRPTSRRRSLRPTALPRPTCSPSAKRCTRSSPPRWA